MPHKIPLRKIPRSTLQAYIEEKIKDNPSKEAWLHQGKATHAKGTTITYALIAPTNQ